MQACPYIVIDILIAKVVQNWSIGRSVTAATNAIMEATAHLFIHLMLRLVNAKTMIMSVKI